MRCTFTFSTLENQTAEMGDDPRTHLTRLKLDSPDGLAVSNGKVRVQSRVTNDRRKCVPVLVC
jgi:hypothetical protein